MKGKGSWSPEALGEAERKTPQDKEGGPAPRGPGDPTARQRGLGGQARGLQQGSEQGVCRLPVWSASLAVICHLVPGLQGQHGELAKPSTPLPSAALHDGGAPGGKGLSRF